MHNLVPRAFPLKNGWRLTQFLHYADTKRCFSAIALICKTVRMYAQAVKQKVWSEAEKGERDHERVRLVASRV